MNSPVSRTWLLIKADSLHLQPSTPSIKRKQVISAQVRLGEGREIVTKETGHEALLSTMLQDVKRLKNDMIGEG